MFKSFCKDWSIACHWKHFNIVIAWCLNNAALLGSPASGPMWNTQCSKPAPTGCVAWRLKESVSTLLFAFPTVLVGCSRANVDGMRFVCHWMLANVSFLKMWLLPIISIVWLLNEWLRSSLYSGPRSRGDKFWGWESTCSCELKGALNILSRPRSGKTRPWLNSLPSPTTTTTTATPDQTAGCGLCCVLLWAAESQLSGRPCPCSLPRTWSCCTKLSVNKQQYPVPSQENMWGSGRHGKFRRTPMGATNNLKAERGKNNDCYHNKKLSITKNDRQTSHIPRSISQFQKVLAH